MTAEYQRVQITINGEKKKLTWNNAYLYTFRDEQFDHVFVRENKKSKMGMFILRAVHTAQYEALEEHMITQDYPHVHSPTVPEADMEVLEKHLLGDLNDAEFVPEGWDKEESE